MPQILDLTKDYKATQVKNTFDYRDYLLECGMIEISESDLLEMLSNLGYKIDKSMCLDYYNNLNEKHYFARSMDYMDIKTKQSFAHFEQSYSNHVNLEKLQKIRRNHFVFTKNRIWDL